jgi:NADPH:quinone reductase-like Zn-dependent oxidoreductase
VIVIGAGAEKLRLAESLGADVLIDREKEPEWHKAVYAATGKRGVEVVVDNVGTTYPLSFRAAAKDGRILTVGNTGGPKFEIDNRFIFSKHLSLLGSTMGTRQDFAEVMELVTTGQLKVALDSTFPLREARAAQERLESGQQLGKITLEI